jgi:hypothetical protein
MFLGAWCWLARLLLVGPSRGRGRLLIRKLGAIGGHAAGRLELLPLSQIVDPHAAVTVHALSSESWNIDGDEMLAILALASRTHPATMFEFATFDGRTTLDLAANVPDARIYAIDLSEDAGQRFQHHPVRDRISQLFGDTRTTDLSKLSGTVDFVFIDGGHDYDVARSVANRALQLTAGRDALIIWHDYGVFPGVTRAVDELSVAGRRYLIAGTTLACLHRVDRDGERARGRADAAFAPG